MNVEIGTEAPIFLFWDFFSEFHYFVFAVCTKFFVRRGIRVIVGHYKGDQSPSPNFTWAELNQNRNNHVSFYIN